MDEFCFFVFLSLSLCAYMQLTRFLCFATKTDSSDSDPSEQGNQVSSLLHPKGEPSVPLMCGFLVASPDSVLSDDVIDPFDVLASGADEINDAKPFPDSSTFADDMWEPKASDYEHVKALWTEPRWGAAGREETVSKWAGLFSVWAVDHDELCTLQSGMPKGLRAKFEALYAEPPCILVGEGSG